MEDAHMDEAFYEKMKAFFPPNVTSSGTPHSLQSDFTIRDHFAGLAMQALISSADRPVDRGYITELAYLYADEMTKERAK